MKTAAGKKIDPKVYEKKVLGLFLNFNMIVLRIQYLACDF